jgi:hypothetical protein
MDIEFKKNCDLSRFRSNHQYMEMCDLTLDFLYDRYAHLED